MILKKQPKSYPTCLHWKEEYNVLSSNHLLRISNQNPQMIISGLSTNFSIKSWKYGPNARLWFQLRYFEGTIKNLTIKYMQQTEILHKFFKDPRICICDNSGLSSRGNPIGRFMSRNDNTHLSYDGNKIFASNLKSSIRECLGIRFQPQPYRRSDNWTYNNSYHDGPYDGYGRDY